MEYYRKSASNCITLSDLRANHAATIGCKNAIRDHHEAGVRWMDVYDNMRGNVQITGKKMERTDHAKSAKALAITSMAVAR